jgi:hypothetical protein
MSSHPRRAVASAALLLLIITVITFPFTRTATMQTAAPGCAQVPGGIVSWYPADVSTAEDGNAVDIVGHNHGTLMNGATFAPGKVGTAFSLDGVDDQIEVPDSASLDLNTLSIDAWIKRTTTADARIVDKITAEGADGYDLDIVNNRLRLLIGGASVTGATPIETGVYTLVAGTFDGTNLRVYVNGTLDGTTTVESTTTPTNALPLHIGSDSTGAGNLFGGQIDEVELFNRALAQEEIQSLVNADSAGKCRSSQGGAPVIISEFRFRGPGPTRAEAARAGSSPLGGGSIKPSYALDPNGYDEFIELYNNSDADVTVSTVDGSAGWALAADRNLATPSNTVITVITNGTIIPARAHYLVANSLAYSLGGYPAGSGTTATPDQPPYSGFDIPNDGGIALFNTADNTRFSQTTRLDAAGFSLPPQEQLGVGGGGKRRPAVTNTLFVEGNGLTNPVSANAEHSFVRKLTTGRPQDTDDNASDFQLVATDPTTLTDATLGAPGPENLTSPIQRSLSLIKSTLIEPCAASSQSPNRVRDFTSDPANHSTSGTLLLRRRFTNTTDRPVTRLRFRVVDITTLTNPVAPDGVADLRAISSGVTPVTVSGAGCSQPGTSINVQGLTLEGPPTQPLGGGLNSTLSPDTISLDAPLAANAGIDLNFLFGVERPGTFRAFVLVEATFDSQPIQTFRPKQKGASTGDGSSQVKPKARPRAKH